MQSGTSLNAIQQLLGHRSLHTTSTYLQHIAPAAAVAEDVDAHGPLALPRPLGSIHAGSR